MCKKKTHEEFVNKVEDKYNGNIKVLGKYTLSKNKILCKCLKHNYEFDVLPSFLLSSRTKFGCSLCAIDVRAREQTKTHNQFVEEMKNINPDIQINSPYIKNNKKVECLCVLDGYSWSATPSDLLSKKSRCRLCKKRESSLDNVKILNTKIHKFNPYIDVVGNYISCKTKISCVCNFCNSEFESTPNTLLTNYSCPMCGKGFVKNSEEFVKQKHNLFVEKLKQINSSIAPVGTYVGSKNKLKVRCSIDGCEWLAIPSNLLTGHSGCPVCNSISKGESRIKNFLTDKEVSYEYQFRHPNLRGKSNYKLSYDFFLPEYNLFIEFQGKQHETPIDYFGGESRFNTQIENDRAKKDFALQNNIELLEIWYYDYDNIEQILTEKLNINNIEKSS